MGKACARLYCPGLHADVEWQAPQSEPKRPAWKDGSAWQAAQALGVPENPFAWHLLQTTLVCAPVSGKPDLLWSKVTCDQLAVTWQAAQSFPNFPPC